MQLVLIPVAPALPALDAYFDTHRADGSPLSTDEVAALARIATRVIETGELLVSYAMALGGKPALN